MGFDNEIAQRLPSNIRFGTSSWKYEGWRGAVYRKDYRSKRAFEQDSLQEYASFDWSRTVGVDSTYYRPASSAQLEKMASQVQSDFRWVSKVWDRISVHRYGRAKRYGERAGKENPDFLNPDIFIDSVLPPYRTPQVRQHTGPFVFQFSPFYGPGPATCEAFLDKLERFLGALPTDFRYAVEIRTRELLTPRYFHILNDHGAVHCFNHWSTMPPLVEQMRSAAAGGGIQADWYIARLLTPLGLGYQEAVDRFKPYERLQQRQPQMRRDVLRLARRAVQRGAEAWVLVNNRIEGHSPTTIDELGRAIVEDLEAS